MTPDEFKAWRERLGFTQQQAALALGLSRGSVENYERGQRREDNRPVEIPLTVDWACDAVTLDEACKRQDISIVPLAWQGQIRRLAGLLPEIEHK